MACFMKCHFTPHRMHNTLFRHRVNVKRKFCNGVGSIPHRYVFEKDVFSDSKLNVDKISGFPSGFR